jgi:branched-chain amino acid transport system permease protein
MNGRSALGEAMMALSGCLVVIALALTLDNPQFADFVLRLSIFGLYALSLNLLVGYAGLVSFGHAMFFGFGAYAFGLLMQTGLVSIPLAFVVSIAGAAVLAVSVGALCIRLKDIYFGILTLAFQMLLHAVILSWVSLTGGDQGLQGGIPRPPFLGVDLGNPKQFFVLACVFFFGLVLLVRQMVESPFGYSLRMVRDNPERALALGLSVQRYKLAAFVISGTIAANAGVLMSLYVSGAYPNFAYWTLSGDGILMIMLGGMTVFLGPIAGAGIFLMLNGIITRTTEYSGLVMGIVLLCVVLGLRRGVLDFVFERCGPWAVRRLSREG